MVPRWVVAKCGSTPDVQRLNFDERGNYLGEFHTDDLVLVVLDNGDFYTTNF